MGSEVLRVGLKHHPDEDAEDKEHSSLGGFALMTDVFPDMPNGGLHWHLDAYAKIPIMNMSLSGSDKYNYPPVQKWTHITAVWDNEAYPDEEKGVALLYIDGELRGEIKTKKQEMYLTVQNIEIGSSWGGAIDELMVFDKPLNECQAKAI